MYWISKKLYDKNLNTTNPDAQKMDRLRNALEHKYVKVYDSVFQDKTDGSVDKLAEYISEYKLKNITLEIAKTARELIILLSLAIHINENKRSENDVPLPQLALDLYEDDWKA